MAVIRTKLQLLWQYLKYPIQYLSFSNNFFFLLLRFIPTSFLVDFQNMKLHSPKWWKYLFNSQRSWT